MRTIHTKVGSHSSLGRALLKMTRLVVLVGVLVMTTGYVHASVQYERTGVGVSIPQGYGGTGGSKLFYLPQSSGTMISYDGTPFFTTSTTITTVRVKIVSGTTCSAMASMPYPLRVMAQTGTTYNVTSGTASGEYCDLTFGTPIPTSTALTYVRGAYDPSGATSTAQYFLDGSLSNSGYSFDWDSGTPGDTATATGGFAFALCSASSCSGVSWAPPVSGIASQTSPTATTYTANPVTFSGTYNNLDTFDQIELALVNTTNSYTLSPLYASTSLSNGTGISYSFQKTLPLQGSYTGNIRLYDSINASSTPWVALTSFGLGTTTVATSSSSVLSDPTPLNCSTFDIGCYIKQAFVWLLYPSSESRAQFLTLSSTLETKFPFAYAYDIGDLYDEMFNGTGTSTVPTIAVETAIGTLTFISEDQLEAIPYIDTFRTLIGYGIWFMFAMFCYRRILRIHDTTTTV